MKALEGIIETLVMHKFHGKSKQAHNHRCQVNPLDYKWKRGSLLVGREAVSSESDYEDMAISVQCRWSSSHTTLV